MFKKEKAEKVKKRKTLVLLGFLGVALFASPHAVGRFNGVWVPTSPDPVSTCEAVGNYNTVCAEWTTSTNSESAYQPCCISPDAVLTSDLGACALLEPRLEEDF